MADFPEEVTFELSLEGDRIGSVKIEGFIDWLAKRCDFKTIRRGRGELSPNG